jgi:type II secretory pathway component GspD/PulD (secretin)
VARRTRPIAPKFVGDGEGSPLSEIASFLQTLTGVNFLVSTAVTEELGEEETTIRLQLPERSVRKVLDIIADTSENLRWKIEDGTVTFVTKDELKGGQVLAFYEVRDIIHPVPNFPGREININPSGINVAQDIFGDEELEEREGLVVTGDALEGLIRDNIAPESWDEDPRNSVRITESGTLVVNQTPEVQEQVVHLLDDLREATGIMVDIQARFLKVEDNFLEDIGVDWRGLGQPELGREIGTGTDLGSFYDDGGDGDVRSRVENLYDIGLGDTDVLTGAGGLSFQWTYLNDLQMQMVLRAVSKSERLELVTAPKVLVFNTARANIAVMNQVAYVQDFDVEIAQAASIADPIVNVVQDGVVLDVRPVVSADRRFIMMELRPTVAVLKRPIQQIATTLGSQNTVTIQLPELDIQRVRTTVPMPDGGTVMLGGLKVSEKQDLRSGVPILNQIPVVRFLFERKGNYISNRKLLILIKANIVIPAEHEPSPAQLGS